MSTTTEREIKVADGLGNADASQVLAGATFSSETGFNQQGTFAPDASNITYNDGTVADTLDDLVENGVKNGTELTDILPSGQTTITFTSEEITNDSKLNAVYTSIFDVQLESASFGDGTLTLVFPAQEEDMTVVALINATSKGENGIVYEGVLDELHAHTENTDNPHGVTASQVGLGNVPNVSTNNQTPTYTEASSNTALTSGEVLSTAFGKIAKAVSSLISHLSNVSNPHSVTKEQVGLGNVDNTSDVDKPVSTATNNELNKIKRAVGYISTKNYLPNRAISKYKDGMTCVVADDKTIKVSGTKGLGSRVLYDFVGYSDVNNAISEYAYEEIAGLEDGVEYILSGCPSGGAEGTYGIYGAYLDSSNQSYNLSDYGQGVRFTHVEGRKYRIYLGFNAGVNVTNYEFKPMLRRADATSTYEPYIGAKSEIDSIGQIITDNTYKVTAKADATAITEVASFTNLSKGVYMCSFRAIGLPNALVIAQIRKNDIEIDGGVGNTYTGANNYNSAQVNISTIFEIHKSTDVISFSIASSVALTDRNGQNIKIVKIR